MGAHLEISRHLFSIDEYHRMGEAGILAPDIRVELLEGELVRMAPIGSWHAGTIQFAIPRADIDCAILPLRHGHRDLGSGMGTQKTARHFAYTLSGRPILKQFLHDHSIGHDGFAGFNSADQRSHFGNDGRSIASKGERPHARADEKNQRRVRSAL